MNKKPFLRIFVSRKGGEEDRHLHAAAWPAAQNLRHWPLNPEP